MVFGALKAYLQVCLSLLLAVASASASPLFVCERVREAETYTVSRVEYPSPLPADFPGGTNAVAWYYEPKSPVAAKAPGVVCLHILGGDGSISRTTAANFAAHGLPAIIPELPLFLSRRPDGGIGRLLASPEGPRRLAEAINAIPDDIRHATDFLASRSCVDGNELRITGTSMGGILAVSAAGKDARFKKSAFILAGGDLKEILASGRGEVEPFSKAICRANAEEKADLDRAFAALEPLKHVDRLKARAAAGNVRMVNAAEDEVIPASATAKLRDALGLGCVMNAYEELSGVGHYSAISRLPALQDGLADWFGGRAIAASSAEMRKMFAGFLKVLQWEPEDGRTIAVGATVKVVADGKTQGGHLRLRRGSRGRFAVEATAPDMLGKVKDIRLGRGESAWAVSSDGTVFRGDRTAGVDLSKPLGSEVKMGMGIASLVLAEAARTGLPPALGEIADVKIVPAADGCPGFISVTVTNCAVTVRFDEWAVGRPETAEDFAPPAAKAVRTVDGSVLERMFAALISFAVDRRIRRKDYGIRRSGCGELRYEKGKTPVLVMRGSSEEMGAQHGTLCADWIRKTHERALLVAAGHLVLKNDWFFERIREVERRTAKSMPPRYLAELDAMSAAAGLTAAEGREITFLPEIFHCSGIAARGKATVGGRVVHARVLDYMGDLGLGDLSLVQVFRPDGFNAWVSIGFAGLNGTVTAMNEKGLAMGEMGGRGEGKWDGLPMTYLMRRIMEECATVAEAKEMIRSVPLTCDYYYVLSDRTGDMTTVEAKSGESLTFVGPGEGHPMLRESFEDICWVTAPCRQPALCERLHEYYGRIDAETMKEIVRRPVAMRSNLHNAIFLPQSGEVLFAFSGRKAACDSEYERLNLGLLLKPAKEGRK